MKPARPANTLLLGKAHIGHEEVQRQQRPKHLLKAASWMSVALSGPLFSKQGRERLLPAGQTRQRGGGCFDPLGLASLQQAPARCARRKAQVLCKKRDCAGITMVTQRQGQHCGLHRRRVTSHASRTVRRWSPVYPGAATSPVILSAYVECAFCAAG
jgi:hypothetical protein